MAEITKIETQYNEKLHFKLFEMPCCKWQLCWINPAVPRFCPNCGKNILLEIKSGEWLRISDPEAWLKRRWY